MLTVETGGGGIMSHFSLPICFLVYLLFLMSETLVDQEAKVEEKQSSVSGKSFITSDLWKTVLALSVAIVAIIVAWCSMEKRVSES